MKHSPLSVGLALQLAVFVPAAQAQHVIPVDNRDGYFVNYEEPLVNPLELTGDGGTLWAVNLADSTVAAINTATMTLLDEIPVALGPETVRHRPATNELWVVCSSSNEIVILDETERCIKRGMRVAFEPHDLVFNSNGTRAFVSLGATNQILKIDASSLKILDTLEFSADYPGQGPLHSEEPRALFLDGKMLYGLSFESGNGSTSVPVGPVFIPLNLWDLGSFFVPRDLDVIRFDLSGAALGEPTLSRMGTINTDILRRPGTNDLYVTNVDSKNGFPNLGDFFFAFNGLADHRLSFAPPGADPVTGVQHIDLNLDTLLPSSSFAMPSQMAMTSDGLLAYVACYETRNTAVVDLVRKKVVAELRSGSFQKATSAGPRGVALDEASGRLYVFNRDLSIDEFVVPVADLTVASPARTVSAGFDITPQFVREGRHLFTDAYNSVNNAQSCNTCHVDGHTDRIGWDLSAFTGDLPNNPAAKDLKRLKVTTSLRGIEETPPFHWRGDRDDLSEFNGALQGLLGGNTLSPAEFEKLEAFVFSLSYRPNPRQNADRTYTSNAAAGFDLFTNKVVINSIDDATGAKKALKCIDCHAMTGFSGTNNQINNDSSSTILALDSTQLRGLNAKSSDLYTNDVDWTLLLGGDPTKVNEMMQTLPVTGFAFANTGTSDTVFDFVHDTFSLTDDDANRITDFCLEFDTGTAPATGFAFTLSENNAAGVLAAPELLYLIAQAAAGHCDLVGRGWIKNPLAKKAVKLFFDTKISQFVSDTSGFGPFTLQALKILAQQGDATLLFFGTPVGMGYRLGRDREMDGLLDGDEARRNTSLLLADTDHDSFPDGHEVANGSDPTDPNSTPNDTTPPNIKDTTAEISWFNGKVAKVRWSTNEFATSRVEVTHADNGKPFSRTFRESKFKKSHVMVIRGLDPQRSYNVRLKGTDPAGNNAVPVLLPLTMEPFLFQNAMFVKSVSVQKNKVLPSGKVEVEAKLLVTLQDGTPVDQATITGTVVEWMPGSGTGNTITPYSVITGATGEATLVYTSVNNDGSGAMIEVISSLVTHAFFIQFFPISGGGGFFGQLQLN